MSKIIENTKSIEKVKVDVETLRNIIERIQKTDTPAAKKGVQNLDTPLKEDITSEKKVEINILNIKPVDTSSESDNNLKNLNENTNYSVFLYCIYCNGKSQQLNSMKDLIDTEKCNTENNEKCWNEGWKKVKLTKVTEQAEDNQYQILPYDYDKTGKKAKALKFLISINYLGGNRQALYWSTENLYIDIDHMTTDHFVFKERNNNLIFQNKVCGEDLKEDTLLTFKYPEEATPGSNVCSEISSSKSHPGFGFSFKKEGEGEKQFIYRLLFTNTAGIDESHLNDQIKPGDMINREELDGKICLYEKQSGGKKNKNNKKRSKKKRKTKDVNKKSKKNINRKKKLLK